LPGILWLILPGCGGNTVTTTRSEADAPSSQAEAAVETADAPAPVPSTHSLPLPETSPALQVAQELPRLKSAPVMASGKHAEGIGARLALLDAEADSWESEVFGERVEAQLARIAAVLTGEESADVLAEVAAPDFRAPPPPVVADETYQDAEFIVTRESPATSAAGETSGAAVPESGVAVDRPEGAAGLRQVLEQLVPTGLRGVDARSHAHVKFKITNVQRQADELTSDVIYHAAGPDDRPTVEQSAIWRCRWTLPTQQETSPRLLSLEISSVENVSRPSVAKGAAVSTLFEECTTAVLGDQPGYAEQLVSGVNHWQARIQTTLGQEMFGHQGISVGDVNGDGLDDLYVSQPGGLPNRLFVQQPDGTARDTSAEAGVDVLEYTKCSSLVDLDNDGDQDLVLLTAPVMYLFENRGDGHFQRKATIGIESKNAQSLAIADYDNDGQLDIYVCGYSYPNVRAHVPRPYHDANNGFPNYLFRNLGNWRFGDVTVAAGLDENNRRYSFAASWEDYDNDGDLDLYVTNDYGRNNLYQNTEGHFRDVAASAGVEDISAGMGVTWGDYNLDGLMDLHVSNMFSSAGSRVTYQRKFRETADGEALGQYQRHARGNSLFENAGDGTFRDVSVEMGITMGRWAWASHFMDINNDGREDLVVANGNLTGDDTKDL
jgi:hypothetical protein